MLNEGIHVKDVDGVILLRPTVSPILYLQQIGRALAAGKKSRPVIFDIVDNFESLYTIDSIRLEVKEGSIYFSGIDTLLRQNPRPKRKPIFRLIRLRNP